MRDSRDAQNAFSALEAIARRWGFRASYSQTADPPPSRVAPRRPSQDPRMPFSGLRAMILIGDFPRAWVAWGIPPPEDSLSDGHVYLIGFQTPAPATRVTRHGREGQRKKERVYTLPSAHVRTRARLYEKENYS